MKHNELIGYGIAAIVAAIILQHTWQWIVGGLAVFGAIYVGKLIAENRVGEDAPMVELKGPDQWGEIVP